MTPYPAIPPLSRHHSAILRQGEGREGGSYPAAILLPIGGGGIERHNCYQAKDPYPAASRQSRERCQ